MPLFFVHFFLRLLACYFAWPVRPFLVYMRAFQSSLPNVWWLPCVNSYNIRPITGMGERRVRKRPVGDPPNGIRLLSYTGFKQQANFFVLDFCRPANVTFPKESDSFSIPYSQNIAHTQVCCSTILYSIHLERFFQFGFPAVIYYVVGYYFFGFFFVTVEIQNYHSFQT